MPGEADFISYIYIYIRMEGIEMKIKNMKKLHFYIQ